MDLNNNEISVLFPQAKNDFVETNYIKEIIERAIDYIEAGFPVHFKGHSGMGKTTLAFHTAWRIGRPVVFISGNEALDTSGLVGGMYGYNKKYLRDNYTSRVLKIEESVTPKWLDDHLTIACERGYTVIYDEFNRSRPETNNVLLSILQEKILPVSQAREKAGYIQVHPDFTAIFTSNPEEYAGVYRTQDALSDRMVDIELETFDYDTEVAITHLKSDLDLADCQEIVRLVRAVRRAKAEKTTPTIRACIIAAKVIKLKTDTNLTENRDLTIKRICRDIILSDVPREEREKVRNVIEKI
ncbi:MAG: gas vesicle protein GvpN [Syntrophomonas sp.]|nr:gas vesicle protein GvpN [Syntrophomonas sp.]